MGGDEWGWEGMRGDGRGCSCIFTFSAGVVSRLAPPGLWAKVSWSESVNTPPERVRGQKLEGGLVVSNSVSKVGRVSIGVSKRGVIIISVSRACMR